MSTKNRGCLRGQLRVALRAHVADEQPLGLLVNTTEWRAQVQLGDEEVVFAHVTVEDELSLVAPRLNARHGDTLSCHKFPEASVQKLSVHDARCNAYFL